jgi:hypothetical protein
MAKNNSKGSEFEKACQSFFKKIFEEIGFLVLSVRRQWSGTQNGFDIRINFLDEDEIDKTLFFECKDYDSDLDWNFILDKILELDSSNYEVDGFIVLSPKCEISNINDNIAPKLGSKFKFPIRYFTPNCFIKELFSIEPMVYEYIYREKTLDGIDRQKILNRFKGYVCSILKEKQVMRFANRIEILDSTKQPTEEECLFTNLDKKLDAVFSPDDPDRELYHKLRCDYKVYLEELTDVNNQLRIKIINWQDNLRIKANRLSKKFAQDASYTPMTFFHDFFEIAGKELLTFYSSENLVGDNEKVLNGVIFELAAECPLDWRK